MYLDKHKHKHIYLGDKEINNFIVIQLKTIYMVIQIKTQTIIMNIQF